VPAIPPPRAVLNPARYGRICTSGSGGDQSGEFFHVMHGKSRGLSDHVDYEKSDWLRCPQTQFKVRFTPRLQVHHGLPVRLSPNFQASTAAIGAQETAAAVIANEADRLAPGQQSGQISDA
jgi:hypothetical protein